MEYVAFVVAVREGDATERRLITDLASLACCELDDSASVSEADATAFIAKLQALADEDYRLTTHVDAVENDNRASGRAQAALSLRAAIGFILGCQNTGAADDNFWKELEADRQVVAECLAQGGGFTIHRIPSLYERVATAFVPFEFKRKVSDESFWADTAPPPLLNAALDAAARVGEGIKKNWIAAPCN